MNRRPDPTPVLFHFTHALQRFSCVVFQLFPVQAIQKNAICIYLERKVGSFAAHANNALM